MQTEPVNLVELYQFDEVYWVPQDRPKTDSVDQNSVKARKTKIQSSEQENKDSHGTKLGVGQLAPTQVLTIEPATDVNNGMKIKPTHVPEKSFESLYTLDHAALPGFASIKTTWMIVGKLSDTERSRLNLIFASPPLLLAPEDWSVYTPEENEPSLTEFVQQCGAKKFVFLGQQPAVWQSDFQVTELVQMDGKLVYFFPRLISSLTEAEKSLKLVFWNALKSMI